MRIKIKEILFIKIIMELVSKQLMIELIYKLLITNKE